MARLLAPGFQGSLEAPNSDGWKPMKGNDRRKDLWKLILLESNDKKPFSKPDLGGVDGIDGVGYMSLSGRRSSTTMLMIL